MGKRHDYDTPWKEALAKYLPDFFAFFFPKIHADIDWTRAPRYLDTELRKLAPDSRSGRQVTDTLVEVQTQGGTTCLVLVHIEVQSQEESDFASRMLDYHTRIRLHYRQPACSLAILADPRSAWRPCSHEEALWGSELRFVFPVAKLTDYRDKLPELETSRNPFAIMVAATLHVQSSKPGGTTRREAKFRMVRGLYQTGLSAKDIVALFKLVDWIMMLTFDQSRLFLHDLTEFERSHKMPYITSVERHFMAKGLEEGRALGLEQGREQGLEQGRELGLEQGRELGLEQGRELGLEQGREQGLEQGREQGQERGLRTAVRNVLQARFGSVPDFLVEAIEQVEDIQALNDLVTFVATVRTLEEVATTLENSRPG